MNPTLHHLQIINAAGYPLSQATVAILNASNEILGGEITDSSGYVILKLASTAKSVRVSYLGYQQVEFRIEEIGDGLIELFPLSSNLPKATVTTQREVSVRGSFVSNSKTITPREGAHHNTHDTDPIHKLNLYPNPSAGRSTLKSDLLTDGRLINVYAATGQLVQSISIHTHLEGQIQIELPTRFANGTYDIELVMASGFTEVSKWVVVR